VPSTKLCKVAHLPLNSHSHSSSSSSSQTMIDNMQYLPQTWRTSIMKLPCSDRTGHMVWQMWYNVSRKMWGQNTESEASKCILSGSLEPRDLWLPISYINTASPTHL
jgi:hypothetical protein